MDTHGSTNRHRTSRLNIAIYMCYTQSRSNERFLCGTLFTMINIETLKEDFTYDQTTGALFKYGKIAPTINTLGYLVIWYQGKTHYAHRIVYQYHWGQIPLGWDIDHINGKKNDNRLNNLRAVPHKLNRRNNRKSKNNTSGCPGVYSHPDGRWRARIKVNYKFLHLGLFEKKEDAIFARKEAEEQHGFH